MTTEDAIQLLSARVDGELTPEQEQTLEHWLREKPDGKIVAEAFRCQDAEIRTAFEPRPRKRRPVTADRVIAQLPDSPQAATTLAVPTSTVGGRYGEPGASATGRDELRLPHRVLLRSLTLPAQQNEQGRRRLWAAHLSTTAAAVRVLRGIASGRETKHRTTVK